MYNRRSWPTFTLTGTPSNCALTVEAEHPCGLKATSDKCLPVDDITCDWIEICSNGGGTIQNECPPGSGVNPSHEVITCECPTATRTTSVYGVALCAHANSASVVEDCFEGDPPAYPDPITEGYRDCVCANKNSGNLCSASCPKVLSTCDGVDSAFSQCWRDVLRQGVYNCNGLDSFCRHIEEFRKVETWGKV